MISSYSIVGEKTSQTLEPLLATPVKTWELLTAKSLTAMIPAVVITWACGALFVLGMALTALSSRVLAAVVSPSWLLLFLVCSPLISLITVAITVAVSSRATDPRSAQQISALMIIPVIGLLLGQLSGIVILSPNLVLIAAVVLAVIAFLTMWLTISLFQREVILTRWR